MTYNPMYSRQRADFVAATEAAVQPLVDQAAAWAEGPGEPGGAGTKSAKEWAEIAEGSASRLGLTALILPGAVSFPNLNVAGNLLELPADTLIVTRDASYTVSSATSIDLSGVVSSAKAVWYVAGAGTFEVKAWNATLTSEEKATHHLVAAIRRAGGTGNNHLSMACPCTVDGVTQGVPNVDFTRRLVPVITSGTAPYFPNMDSAANTLVLPADTILQDGDTQHVMATTQTIDLSVTGSSTKRVFYKPSDGSWVVKPFGDDLTLTERLTLVPVAAARRISSGGVANSLSMSCPCTVDGMAQGPVRAEFTRRLVPIITSGTTSPYFPNFDTAANTLVLPADTILQDGDTQYTLVTTQTIDLSATVSSTKRVFYKPSDSTWVVKSFSDDLTFAERLTLVPVALARRVSPTSAANSLTMTCPCTVNGFEQVPVALDFSRRLVPIITSGTTSPFFPNMDTAANTLVLPTDTILQDGDAQYVLASTQTIDLSATTSSTKRVFYKPSDGSWVVKATSDDLTLTERLTLVPVAVARRVSATSVANSLSMSCPCTINGVSQTPTNADFTRRLVPIITSGTAPYFPDFDTAANTLVLPADTILQDGDAQYVMSGTQTIDLSVIGSSTKRVFYKPSDGSWVVKAFSDDLTAAERLTLVPVATARRVNATSVANSLTMTCPCTVNGVAQTPNNARAENRAGAAIEGIHHRGFMAIAPENTLAAYKASANVRNYTVEGDIQWTSDGVAVLLHDATIDRTSDGTGAIVGMTLATAKSYDFGSWKGAAFTGETIPTWDEYLICAKKLDLTSYMEIKTNATLAQVQGLLASVKKAGMRGRIQFDSTHLAAIQKVVAEEPTQDVGYLVLELDDAGWTAAIASASALLTGSNRVAIEPPLASLTKARVEAAHEAGLRVVVYTIDLTADVATLADMGVDGIITNQLNIAQVIRDAEL